MVDLLHPTIKVFDSFSIIALQLSRESYLVFPVSTLSELSPLQSEKAELPISVTLFGMVTEFKPLQP